VRYSKCTGTGIGILAANILNFIDLRPCVIFHMLFQWILEWFRVITNQRHCRAYNNDLACLLIEAALNWQKFRLQNYAKVFVVLSVADNKKNHAT
jgi:hypothetical protein